MCPSYYSIWEQGWGSCRPVWGPATCSTRQPDYCPCKAHLKIAFLLKGVAQLKSLWKCCLFTPSSLDDWVSWLKNTWLQMSIGCGRNKYQIEIAMNTYIYIHTHTHIYIFFFFSYCLSLILSLIKYIFIRDIYT